MIKELKSNKLIDIINIDGEFNVLGEDMQTFITDKNYSISASNLDNKRLGAQIYEGIHILASLLDVNDKLVTPKRSVKNHPVAKF